MNDTTSNTEWAEPTSWDAYIPDPSLRDHVTAIILDNGTEYAIRPGSLEYDELNSAVMAAIPNGYAGGRIHLRADAITGYRFAD